MYIWIYMHMYNIYIYILPGELAHIYRFQLPKSKFNAMIKMPWFGATTPEILDDETPNWILAALAATPHLSP